MFVIYCRIADKTKETKQMLQEEIDDREGFNTEAVQTVDWLVETKTELQQLGPTMEAPEVSEKIEKIKVTTHVYTHYYNSNLIWGTVSHRVDELISSDHTRRKASRAI